MRADGKGRDVQEDLRTGPRRRSPSPNDMALVRLAWCMAIALLLSLLAPSPLVTLTFSALLAIASVVLLLAAGLLREPIRRRHLTRWDLAALLYLMSAFSGWLVDRREVRDFLVERGFLA